jgi:hypothetical protein
MVEPSTTRLDGAPCRSKYIPSIRTLPAVIGLKPRTSPGL